MCAGGCASWGVTSCHRAGGLDQSAPSRSGARASRRATGCSDPTRASPGSERHIVPAAAPELRPQPGARLLMGVAGRPYFSPNKRRRIFRRDNGVRPRRSHQIPISCAPPDRKPAGVSRSMRHGLRRCDHGDGRPPPGGAPVCNHLSPPKSFRFRQPYGAGSPTVWDERSAAILGAPVGGCARRRSGCLRNAPRSSSTFVGVLGRPLTKAPLRTEH